MVAPAKTDPQTVLFMARFAESLQTIAARENIPVEEVVKDWDELGIEFRSSFTELKMSRAVHDLLQAAEVAEQQMDPDPSTSASLESVRRPVDNSQHDREVRSLELSEALLTALRDRESTYVMPVATRR